MGMLTFFSSIALCARTIVHMQDCLAGFSSQPDMSADAAARLDADDDLAIDADDLGDRYNQARALYLCCDVAAWHTCQLYARYMC